MQVTKASFGNVVWVTKAEMDNAAVKKEIERLKGLGRVAVFCTGRQGVKQVIQRLIEQQRP